MRSQRGKEDPPPDDDIAAPRLSDESDPVTVLVLDQRSRRSNRFWFPALLIGSPLVFALMANGEEGPGLLWGAVAGLGIALLLIGFRSYDGWSRVVIDDDRVRRRSGFVNFSWPWSEISGIGLEHRRGGDSSQTGWVLVFVDQRVRWLWPARGDAAEQARVEGLLRAWCERRGVTFVAEPTVVSQLRVAARWARHPWRASRSRP